METWGWKRASSCFCKKAALTVSISSINRPNLLWATSFLSSDKEST